MAQSQQEAGAQLSSSARHDVELAAHPDQLVQRENNESARLISKKHGNSSSDQHWEQQHASNPPTAVPNAPYSDRRLHSHPDTSSIHLPEPLIHVAETLQEDLQQVAHATHDYIVKHHRGITTFLVAITRVLQQTDASLLPAVYLYVGCAFQATPAQLGTISFASLLAASFASPFGGLLGHKYNRVRLIAVSCWLWACCTCLFASSNSTTQGMAAWALNGAGLGIMIPNAQSLVADYYDATHRGRAFGMLLAVGNLGSMLSSVYATNIGGWRVLGMQGWRFAFLTVAAISAAAGIAMWFAAKDPRCSKGTWQLDEYYRHHSSGSSSGGSGSSRPVATVNGSSSSSRVGVAASAGQHRKSDVDHSSRQDTAAAVGSHDRQQQQPGAAPPIAKVKGPGVVVGGESERSSLLRDATGTAAAAGRLGLYGQLQQFMRSDLVQETWVVLSTPSFIVVVIQGFLGSMPWGAFAFTTLYLQLQGWTDVSASAIMALFSMADAFGAFLGGVVGDWAAARFPNHGRITACQFSVGIGVPLSLLIFQGLPMGSGTGIFILYGAVFACMGLLISWAATACNNPIFAEIVPPHLRTLVYAFDRCLEGALSAIGAPMVGVTAQDLFHFSGTASTSTTQGCTSGAHFAQHQPDLTKARALGNALTLFSTIPWTLCCLVYTLLHWTYPKDKCRGSCTGMPLEAVRFSPLAGTDEADVNGLSGADVESARDTGFSGPEGPGTPGLLDKIDEYISHPRVSVSEVPEVELQEARILRQQ